MRTPKPFDLARSPLALPGALLVAGASAWPRFPVGANALLAGSAAMAALALGGRRWPAARLALAIGCLLLGAGSAAIQPRPPSLPNTEVAITGRVLESSGRRAVIASDLGKLELSFDDEAPPTGRHIAALTRPAAADIVLPGAPDRARSRVRSGMTARRARRWLALDPTPTRDPGPYDLADHGALLRALATGRRAGVPEQTVALLRRTGTIHLLAISGLHVGLVAGMAGMVGLWMGRLAGLSAFPLPPRMAAAIASLSCAVAYADRVGWPVSARRAVWMVGAAVAASALSRRTSPWNLLGLAACAVVLADPGQVGNLPFQLSFGAVLGILLVAPRVARLVPPDAPRLARWIASSLGATLGATAGTLPVTAWSFQQLAPLSPLANLVAAPLLGAVAVPAAILAGLLPGDAGLVALAVGEASVEATLALLQVLDTSPVAPAVGPAGAALLAGAVLLRRHPMAAACLATCALLVRPFPVGRLVVTFLGVGQGDATLVEWPDGTRWLVDGGPPSERVLHYLRRRGIRSLDVVALSHPHPDHLGGLLPVARDLAITALWVPRPPTHGESDYWSLWMAAWRQGAVVHGPDDAPPSPPGGLAEALHPLMGWRAVSGSRANEESLVLLLSMGARRFLLPGDVEKRGERALLVNGLPSVAVAKVPHHGSRTSSHPSLVAALRPTLAVIPCGAGNPYHHPAPEVLARWRSAAVARTDQDGTIEVSTDGDVLHVRAWRSETGWRDIGGRLRRVAADNEGETSGSRTGKPTRFKL